MAALGAVYAGWLLIGYFLWKDRGGRLYWILYGALWVSSWLLNYRLWPTPKKTPFLDPALRIATWNMDASDYDRRLIEKDLDFLARMGADIVCLQELYLGDYSAECFAERAGYPYILFGKAGPAMGMAILSRYPITLHEDPFLLKGSTNGILIGEVVLPSGDTALVVNVHYPSYRLGRLSSWLYSHWRQVWKAQQRMDTLLAVISQSWSGPLWIGGDFNAIPLSYAVGELQRSGLKDSYAAAEWLEGPTWRPFPLRIDYIWGPCIPHRQKTYWAPKHHHAYVLAEYGGAELAAVIKKSATFARLGR